MAEQRAFYARTLGLAIVREQRSSISFRAGESEIEFVDSGALGLSGPGTRGLTSPALQRSARYHFAFNIPENQLDAAKGWLEKRTRLLHHRASGGPIVHFPAWNAHALYFLDPAGNILELIARHTLPNASHSAFDTEALLCVSEIGIVTDAVAAAVAGIQHELGVSPYIGASGAFVPMGDERGLFIVVETGRAWMPTDDVPAEKAEATVVVRGPRPGQYAVEGADVTIEAER